MSLEDTGDAIKPAAVVVVVGIVVFSYDNLSAVPYGKQNCLLLVSGVIVCAGISSY